MSPQEKILVALRKAVVEYRVDDCRKIAQKALDNGLDPTLVVMEGLARGMEKAGVLYDTNEYFVPEVLMCSEGFYEGFNVLRPYIKTNPDTPRARIVIGCVQGDIHDIGKNLVKLMFEAAGWEVYDLGSDVPLDKFLEKQAEVQADIIAVSAMMTTTMMGIKKMISRVKLKGQYCLILIGGTPVTRDIAYFFGADGYAPSAGSAVSEGLKMIERSNGYKNNEK